jgi:hypothetical protein
MHVEAARGVLGERPTALPLGMSEFNERQFRGQFQVPRSAKTVARRVWRLVPSAQRYRIAGWVQKLVADRDEGRPLPSGLSLIRPVWRLLPRRLRRGIVSSFL